MPEYLGREKIIALPSYASTKVQPASQPDGSPRLAAARSPLATFDKGAPDEEMAKRSTHSLSHTHTFLRSLLAPGCGIVTVDLFGISVSK